MDRGVYGKNRRQWTGQRALPIKRPGPGASRGQCQWQRARRQEPDEISHWTEAVYWHPTNSVPSGRLVPLPFPSSRCLTTDEQCGEGARPKEGWGGLAEAKRKRCREPCKGVGLVGGTRRTGVDGQPSLIKYSHVHGG